MGIQSFKIEKILLDSTHMVQKVSFLVGDVGESHRVVCIENVISSRCFVLLNKPNMLSC